MLYLQNTPGQRLEALKSLISPVDREIKYQGNIFFKSVCKPRCFQPVFNHYIVRKPDH